MKTLILGVLAMAMVLGVSGVAQAIQPPMEYVPQKHEVLKDDYIYRHGCKYEKIVKYVTCIEYEKREEAYTKYVTEYDHCDKPYQVKKVCYRTVEVPVKVTKKIVKWIKVCR